MNKIFISNAYIGKKGVELKTTNNDKNVATFSVSVLKDFSKEKEYDFFNVVLWGGQAEWLANNYERIKKIGLSGRLQSRSYDAKDGTKRYVVEIVADHVEVEEWGEKQEGGYDADITPIDEEPDIIPF